MADIGELLDQQLSRGAFELDTNETVLDLAQLGREQISELAEAMSGVGRAGSPTAYRSARRQLERWRKGGVTPTVRSRDRLRGAKRHANARLRAFRARGGNMRLQVSWYGSRRPEWLPPQRWVHIRRPIMQQVIRKWASGDSESAAKTLLTEFYERYDVPNLEDWGRDVTVLDILLEPR